MTGRRLRWAVIETEVEPPETTLVRALVDRSRQAGAVAGVGHCVDVSGALPFGPVLEAAYQLAGPDIALLDTSAPNALGLLVNAFSDLTDRAPAVLVLEDLQWADQYTVDFARAFVRSSRARALLVMTYRSDDAAPALRDALVDLRRADGVTHLPLGPLPPAALGDLATRRLGRDLDGDAMTALFRRSEGNPLYAEEILAAETPGIPASLGDLLTRHVRGLSAETRSMVRLAAVGSSIVDVDSLADGRTSRSNGSRPGFARRWTRTSSCDRAHGWRSGTRCCATRCTRTCCRPNGCGCTNGMRGSSPPGSARGPEPLSGGRWLPTWPSMRPRPVTRRPPWAPMSMRGRRPDGSGPGPMPRRTTSQRWSCGATCPRPTVRPGSPRPTSPAGRRTACSCCSSRSVFVASYARPSRCWTTRPSGWRPAGSTPWSRVCRTTPPTSSATRRPPPARFRWPARPPAASGSRPGS